MSSPNRRSRPARPSLTLDGASTRAARELARRRSADRSRWVTAVAVAIACLLLPTSNPTVAGAAPTNDDDSIQELQQRRSQVRSERAEQASQVNALEATDAEVTAALSALNAQVSAQKDRVEEAERAVTQANEDRVAAEEAQAVKQEELDALRVEMRESAVEAYVNVGSSDSFTTLGSDDVNDTVHMRTLLSMRANENVDLVERFRSVQEDLEIQRAAASEAEERARTQQEAVESRLADLADATEEQEAFAAQVEQRIESALAEADALSAIDAELSSSISSKQAEIARAIAAQRAAEKARAEARAAQARPALPAPSSSASSGSSRGGSSSGGGGGGGGGAPPAITGSGSIVSVGGIRVHQSIAGNLQRLLSAASSAGIQFSGGGFRDPAGQISVRRNNCGSSNYAIYEMPASQCSPPTARPGSSMHERGLAIDFTQGGRTLTRGSAGFSWLRANAASFGFFNLPSEPWHWSTNGN